MKKTGRAIFLAVAAMLCCTFGTAFAADPEPNSEDDFEFSVNDDFTEITITGYTGTRTDVVIPASIQDVPVVRIDKRAFQGKSITSLYVPEGVKELAEGPDSGAFFNCDYLQSVTLPAGIYIGEKSFMFCDALETVVLGENSTIGKQAFESCSSLKSIDIPTGCTLRSGAFTCCENLESVVLPEGLKIISNECFYGCRKLADVDFPSTLKAIGSKAFDDCPIPSVDVPEGVIYIGRTAFNSGAITSLSLPKSLKWIGTKWGEDFICGDNIQAVTVPEGLKLFAIDDCTPYGSDPREYSSDARKIIQGAAISKSIKLQKQLATIETVVLEETGDGYYNYNNQEKYFRFFNHNKELFDDFLKAGLSEKEAKDFFADCYYAWW